MTWRALGRSFLAFGCDPRKVIRSLVAWPRFFHDAYCYARSQHNDGSRTFSLRLGNLYPVLLDGSDNAGNMGIYFQQDLFVARKIYHEKPSSHLDIGSRIDGFISHLLVFMDVEIVDVRKINNIDGLTSINADARKLRQIASDSIPSLSCLHALEHFGLGRYGDEIDPKGWEKALVEMYCR